MVKKRLKEVPEWVEPGLQGLAYWLGAQHAMDLGAKLSEGAIAWELMRLMFAHKDPGRFLEGEVMYRYIPEIVKPGDARADLIVANVQRLDRSKPYRLGEVEAVIEVKHSRAPKKLIFADIDFLRRRRNKKPFATEPTSLYHRQHNAETRWKTLLTFGIPPTHRPTPGTG